MTVLPDDHDDKWSYAGHTRAKHEILRYYLVPWIKKLSSPNGKLRLFDCFAGRGQYVEPGNGEPIELHHIDVDVDIPGSPLIMLDVATELSHLSGEIECVFLEPKEKNRSILEDTLSPVSGLPTNVSYRTEPGQFQDRIKNLVTQTGGWSHPSFFFTDPFGYEDLDYDVVTEIGTTPKFELLITLMAENLIRWKSVNKHSDAFKTLFGTPKWKAELEDFESEYWDDDEVEYYCSRLQEGGISKTIAYLVTRKETAGMVYYLVHGSTHIDALEMMRNAMDECGTGRFAYAPQRPELAKEQTGLNAFSQTPPEERFQEYLLTKFSGQKLSFDQIVKQIIEEDEYVAYRRQDIRNFLKTLREKGLVETTSITSKTERGLQGDDLVLFPSGD